MRNKKVYIIAFSGVATALNIVLGIITHAIGIPLYLDTLGTMLTAILYGPLAGVIVGTLTNVITGLLSSPQDIPFFIVNAAVGLITGLIVKKFKFDFKVALITGLLFAIICPALGTPIGIVVYGGLDGSWSDVFVTSLVQGGQTIFAASFIRNIASNLIDKVGTSIVAWALLQRLPRNLYEPDNTQISSDLAEQGAK